MSGNISRRTFVSGTTGAAVLATWVDPAAGQEPHTKLRAAVLEFRDRWTKQSVGLGQLLEQAGFEVQALDLSRPADQQPQPLDLIAFGSFTNNGDEYKKYVAAQTESLRRFVHQGGVVLEMTQSDQYGTTIDYLPEGQRVVRGDRDLGIVFAIDRGHPIVHKWMGDDLSQHTDQSLGRKNVNWESFDEWAGLRVLLASEVNGASPCLLEGAHGRGRFLMTSLWIDKCYHRDGSPSQPPETIRASQGFFHAVAHYVALVKQGEAPEVVPTPLPQPLATGPMVGHVDTESARVWFRPAEPHHALRDWTCTFETDGHAPRAVACQLDPDHDFTAIAEVSGLAAATAYRFTIRPTESPEDFEPLVGRFTTPPAMDEPARVVLGLGSCAPSKPSPVWDRIVNEGCEGFVFLGDTPYIDSSDLVVARRKHRVFLEQPEIRELIRQMPCWGTWDDHDFGLNDGHGDFPGKHVCRIAFTEYRANATFGHDEQGQPQPDRFAGGRGIYTAFRYGPVEVFLIDPRWFSRTEPSWADPDKTTCLGAHQWQWLKQGLLNSTTPFKLLTTGMIWDNKQNRESDDWHTYAHEREAIFDFVKENRIGGCLLIGGDIHVSRALNYGDRVGYELWQFIISPLHERVIPSLNVPHPNLVHSAVEPNVFLKLVADTTVNPATLTATWINMHGERIFEVQTDTDKLGG